MNWRWKRKMGILYFCDNCNAEISQYRGTIAYGSGLFLSSEKKGTGDWSVRIEAKQRGEEVLLCKECLLKLCEVALK